MLEHGFAGSARDPAYKKLVLGGGGFQLMGVIGRWHHEIFTSFLLSGNLCFPGSVNLPSVAVGMLAGGVIMKKVGLSLKAIPRFSVVMLTISTLFYIPLFWMGCSTQKVSEVNHFQNSQSWWVCVFYRNNSNIINLYNIFYATCKAQSAKKMNKSDKNNEMNYI